MTKELNKVAEERVKQLLTQGGGTLQKVGPKLIRGAIEDVYQTLFRLLEKFDKKVYRIKTENQETAKKYA